MYFLDGIPVSGGSRWDFGDGVGEFAGAKIVRIPLVDSVICEFYDFCVGYDFADFIDFFFSERFGEECEI